MTKALDFSVYGDDGLIELLVRARIQRHLERDERVRAFMGQRIEAIVAEMDRRNQDRDEARLVVKPWVLP